MVTLAVDDRLSTAEQIRDMMTGIDPEGSHYALDDPEEALEFTGMTKPGIVWLDIEMQGMSGLEVAAEIKRVSPESNIVFVTGYPQYAVDAFGMHVSGYVLKPVTEAKLRTEIDELRRPFFNLNNNEQKEGLLCVQCFGNFEVFSLDGMVKFSRALSKEAFAYLVDRRGAGCTVGEICSVLWEDRTADKNLKSQCRVIMAALKKDLEAAGAGDVIIKNWNTWAIDVAKVSCDFYDFLKRDIKAINSFRGEYMAQYSWAEMTVGTLFDIQETGAGI